MSRMRWTGYDPRGERWRSARTRGVAASLAVGLLALGGVSSTADVSRAEPPPVSPLTALDQRNTAELAALRSAHAERVRQLQADGATAVQALAAALAEDLSALDRAAGVAAQQRAAAAQAERQAAAGQASTDEQALPARHVQERAAIEAFFADQAKALGPEGTTPTSAARDAVKKSLEARRSSELSALDTAESADRAALDTRVKAAESALAAESTGIKAERSAAESALDAAVDRVRADLERDRERLQAQIATETLALKQRHAQERLDLSRLQATQKAAAAARPSAERSALADRHSREESQLRAKQAYELSAQSAASRQAETDETAARTAAEQQRDADRQAVGATSDAAENLRKSQESALGTSSSASRSALSSDYDGRRAAVKATYDAALSGLPQAHAGLRSALADRLVEQDRQLVKARGVLAARAAVVDRQLTDTAAAADTVAARALQRDRTARERRHRQDVTAAERQTGKDVAAAGRELDRQIRLLDSEIYTLRLRAVAFKQNRGQLTDVGSFFDPKTDPGSLYNVAKRIGALDVPRGITGAGVDVALIDTGVLDVPGLAEAAVEIGPDFSFEEMVPELRGRDTMGHGTHLAGIVAARDEAWLAGDTERRPDRVLGVAPGARLLSVKAGSADGSVDVTQIIAAINWVVANKDTDGRNVRVLNLAFGTDGVQDYRLDPLTYAVERAWQAGIVVVVAAGNDGWATPRLTNPAQDPFVLAVGSAQAVDGKDDVPSSYSAGASQGRIVDLAAPGRSVASLRAVGSSSDDANGAGRVGSQLVRGSGTSQASAVVSGAAALLLQARPELTPDQVKQLLVSTAAKPEEADRPLVGAGYLRVDKALQADVPWVVQPWAPATGTGTLDGARGSVRVVRDGVALEGEMDVFGRDWSGAKWSADAWSGTKWSGAKWSGAKWSADAWSGAKWSGAKWSADTWSGTSWSGATWSSEFWSGAKWSGAKWSADSFTGAKWSGARWSSGGWFGAGWGDGPSLTPAPGADTTTPEAAALAASGG